MHIIISRGYIGGPEFRTLAEARLEMRKLKAQDMAECRKRFGQCRSKGDTNLNWYAIEFGGNLWSCRAIQSVS